MSSYPWTEYNTPAHRRTSGPKGTLSRWFVRWYFRSSAPGLFGWGCQVRSFETREDAMAAGERPLGVASRVCVYEWDHDYKRITIISERKRPRKRAA